MNKRIDSLNYQLGLAVGFAGRNPRFAWKRASELSYFMRRGERYERFNWADRLGNVWLLAKWHRSELTPEQWFSSFRGQFPYPVNGLYYALPETVLKPGLEPDSDDTAQVIRRLHEQMDLKYAAQLSKATEDAEGQKDEAASQFYDEVDSWWPAFGNFNFGARGGHVSYGGI